MKKIILLLLLCYSPGTIQNVCAMEQENLLKVVLFPIHKAVISAGVDSFLVTHFFKEGETFAKGTLLVKFDDRPYIQAVVIEKQNLAEQIKQLRYTEKELKRLQSLHNSKLAGDYELETARLKREVAAIRKLRSRAQLRLAGFRLEKCSITAPFAGRLTAKGAREHEFVRAGEPVVEIIDDHKLLAVMHVPSKYRSHVSNDMEITVKIDETATEYQGRVYSIGAMIEPGSRTFEVKVVIDNQDLVLKAGMSGVVITKIQPLPNSEAP